MKQPWVYMCSPSWSPLPPPSPPDPSRSSQCTSPSACLMHPTWAGDLFRIQELLLTEFSILNVNIELIQFTDEFIIWCCCSVSQSYAAVCNPMDCSPPGHPVPHHLPELAQVHVLCIGDAIQPSHPLRPYSPSALNLSQHQGLGNRLSQQLTGWKKTCLSSHFFCGSGIQAELSYFASRFLYQEAVVKCQPEIPSHLKI